MNDKKCPVDRGKLLIGLECCRYLVCEHCPYNGASFGCTMCSDDALAYICYLEEKLEEAKKA